MYLFLLPAIIVVLVFSLPAVDRDHHAFEKYDIVKGMFASPLIGLDNFKTFVNDKRSGWPFATQWSSTGFTFCSVSRFPLH